MTVVNFSITDTLGKKINQAIQKLGLSSKAEFFRFAALHYMEHMTAFGEPTDAEYQAVMTELKKTIQKKIRHKKLPSLEEQFSDIRP